MPQVEAAQDVWQLVCALLDVADGISPGAALALVDPWDPSESCFERSDGQVVGDDRREVLEWLAHRSDDELNAAAYMAATALDDRTWALFEPLWLQDKPDEFVLEPGARYPVGQFPFPRDAPYRKATLPHHLELRPDETAHVRRHPPDGLATVVRIDQRLHGSIRAALGTAAAVAVVSPNRRSEDFTGWEAGCPVAPTDEAAQAELLSAAVSDVLSAKSADSSSPRLVVLPELHVPEAVLAPLASVVGAHAAQTPLLVAGSRHEETATGEWRNVSTVVTAAGSVDVHHKLHPVPKEAAAGVAAAGELRVFLAGNHRFAVAVCRDFLVPTLVDLLGDLGVTCVSVPAMSPKTEGFEDSFGRLAGRTQALVAVANGPWWFPGESAEGGDPYPEGRSVALARQPVLGHKVLRHPEEPEVAPDPRGWWWMQVGDEHFRSYV